MISQANKDSMNVTLSEPSSNKIKQRNKFISFWIWMSICYCVSSMAVCILELASDRGFWTRYPDPVLFNYVSTICNSIAILSYILLLKWNKIGYFLLIISSLSIMFFGITTGKINRTETDLIISLLPFLSILILSALFFLRKGGVSMWKNLFS